MLGHRVDRNYDKRKKLGGMIKSENIDIIVHDLTQRILPGFDNYVTPVGESFWDNTFSCYISVHSQLHNQTNAWQPMSGNQYKGRCEIFAFYNGY